MNSTMSTALGGYRSGISDLYQRFNKWLVAQRVRNFGQIVDRVSDKAGGGFERSLGCWTALVLFNPSRRPISRTTLGFSNLTHRYSGASKTALLSNNGSRICLELSASAQKSINVAYDCAVDSSYDFRTIGSVFYSSPFMPKVKRLVLGDQVKSGNENQTILIVFWL